MNKKRSRIVEASDIEIIQEAQTSTKDEIKRNADAVEKLNRNIVGIFFLVLVGLFIYFSLGADGIQGLIDEWNR